MERKAFAFATGLFVLILGLAILATSRWLQGPQTTSQPYLVVSESSVTGLAPFSKVYYRGVEVGQVTSIRFATDNSREILILIELEQRVPVTVATYAVLKAQGLTGLAFIELLDDGPLDAPALATSEAQPARIAMRPSLLESFQAVGQGIAEQMQQLISNINQLFTQQNTVQLGRIIDNIESVSTRLDSLLSAGQPAVARLEPLARKGEDTLLQAGATLRSFDATLNTLQARLDEAESLVGRSDAAIDEFSTQLNSHVLPELEHTLGAVSAAASRIETLARELEQNPTALLWGRSLQPPGPGEAGFEGN